jgi:hypothetical protein
MRRRATRESESAAGALRGAPARSGLASVGPRVRSRPRMSRSHSTAGLGARNTRVPPALRAALAAPTNTPIPVASMNPTPAMSTTSRSHPASSRARISPRSCGDVVLSNSPATTTAGPARPVSAESASMLTLNPLSRSRTHPPGPRYDKPVCSSRVVSYPLGTGHNLARSGDPYGVSATSPRVGAGDDAIGPSAPSVSPGAYGGRVNEPFLWPGNVLRGPAWKGPTLPLRNAPNRPPRRRPAVSADRAGIMTRWPALTPSTG